MERSEMTAKQFTRFNDKVSAVMKDRWNEPVKMIIGWMRYERLRKIKPRQFKELHKRNLAGENFDDMVDQLIADEV